MDNHQAKEFLNKGTHEMKKSGVDWLNYIDTHPLQAMLFGLIGYFALKGVMNNKK